MSKTMTVEEAVKVLQAALAIEQAARVQSLLLNGHAPVHTAKKPSNVSSSGRARQIAAMKAYWAKRRKAKAHK